MIITGDYEEVAKMIADIKADNDSMADRLASLKGELGAIKDLKASKRSSLLQKTITRWSVGPGCQVTRSSY